MKIIFSHTLLGCLLLVGVIVCLVGCGQIEITVGKPKATEATESKATKPDGTFWEAVQNEDWALMRRWIEYDRSLVNSRGTYIDHNGFQRARQAGANLATPPRYSGMTPLYLSLWRRNPEMARFFLQNGADPNMKPDSNGITVLHQAVLCSKYAAAEYVDIIKILIDKGVDVNTSLKGDGWNTPLQDALTNTNDPVGRNIVRMLQEAGAR